MEKTLCNCKRQKALPTLKPCGRSQSLTSPCSGSLENTLFLWPLAKNSLCQISANNSGISFPCLWSVGVLESLACVGRDSLAKIKNVLQSCIREKEKNVRGKKNVGKCNKPAASASLDSIPDLELIKNKPEIKGISWLLLSPLLSSVTVPGAGSCRRGLRCCPCKSCRQSRAWGLERSRSLFSFCFSQYNPYRDVIVWCCFSSGFSLISCLWFWGFCEVLWLWRSFAVYSGCHTCSKNSIPFLLRKVLLCPNLDCQVIIITTAILLRKPREISLPVGILPSLWSQVSGGRRTLFIFRLETSDSTTGVSKTKRKLLGFLTTEASRVALSFPRRSAQVWFVSASWSSIPSLQASAFCRQAARGAGNRFSMAVLLIEDCWTSENSQKQTDVLVGLVGNLHLPAWALLPLF